MEAHRVAPMPRGDFLRPAALIASIAVLIAAPDAGTGGLFDDFTGQHLDPLKWYVVEKNWGGKDGTIDYNGGVVAENVHVQNGRLHLRATGNQYDGPLRGINRDGSRRADGKRTGSAIATRDYFGPGRYEVRMRIIPHLGVVSAMWTLHHQEALDTGIVNHEIDIELPGRANDNAPAGFDYALMNTWIGERQHQHTTRYVPLSVGPLSTGMDDNQFHVYRFDWHAETFISAGKVLFYIDDRLQTTIDTHVPFYRSRFYIGAWFPKHWAGIPDFDRAAIEIDWVRITPFADAFSLTVPETYPENGLREPRTHDPNGVQHR
jgi:beta-glucanase (GH16 family)